MRLELIQRCLHRYEQQMKGEAQKRQQQRAGAVKEDADTDTDLAEEANQPELYVAATGAKLSFASAKQRLYYFCDKLPSDQCVLAPPWPLSKCSLYKCRHVTANSWSWHMSLTDLITGYVSSLIERSHQVMPLVCLPQATLHQQNDLSIGCR